MRSSKVCKALGVTLDQIFKFDGKYYRIHSYPDGKHNLELVTFDGDSIGQCRADKLVDMIEHPERVSIPWTQKDFLDASAIKQLYPQVTTIERTTEGHGDRLWLSDSNKTFSAGISHVKNVLPSLAIGETVEISEILEAASDETENL